MSAPAEAALTLFVIAPASGESRLSTQRLADGSVAVRIFSLAETAEAFGGGTVVGVNREQLPELLARQKDFGASHVIIDPIPGSDDRSLEIDNYVGFIQSEA